MKLPRDISPELADAIANLYHVFARYHLGGPVTGCPCCTSPADDALLRSKPLRVLSGDDLSRYAQKAITTLGSEVDLKHFLPRLLELAALEGNIGSTNLEIAMGKLVLAEFPRWPEVEKTAVEQFLRALWRQTIGRFPPDYDDTDYLCSIGCAVDDLLHFAEKQRVFM